MIELGMIQKLKVKRIRSVGAFLNVGDKEVDPDVLLPKKEVDKDLGLGDEIQVFIYKDNQNRPIATRKIPKVTLGKIGLLKVVDITSIGSFFDWGLDKDLFVPFIEHSSKLEKGSSYLIGLYIDKSERLCGTMKIRDYLRNDSPYKLGDWVKGTIYNINEDLGAFVAIDNIYEGLIPKGELIGVYTIGEEITGRVSRIKDDGKIDLSLKALVNKEIDKDGEVILLRLRENEGFLPLNDYSPPEEIRTELSMSKSSFKKALGRLLKENKIDFYKEGIKLK